MNEVLKIKVKDDLHESNLDVIRAVAVLSVVVRHWLGVIGVDSIFGYQVQFLGIFGVVIFFVLTSYVLMISLEVQSRDNKNVFLEFMVRRFFRIYPLAVAVVIFYYFAFSPSFPIQHLLANIFLVQNLTGSPEIFGVMWSLPIEFQMYLFLPFLWRSSKKSLLKMLSIYFIAIAAAGIAFLTKYSFLEVFKYAPIFSVGVVAYGVLKYIPNKSINFYWVIMLVPACLFYAHFGSKSQTVAAYPVAILVGVLIVFCKNVQDGVLLIVCQWISKYSYGIYLIHGLFAVYFKDNLSIGGNFAILCYVAGTALGAVVAFYTIEKPAIAYGKKIGILIGGRFIKSNINSGVSVS